LPEGFGGFDVDSAQAVAGDAGMERYQVLDQLTLLVDKSLVVAEDTRHGTRYRLLETVRQYAQEKLHEAREGDDVRIRHRDHYTAMAARLDAPTGDSHQLRIEQADTEIDNLRAAFAWSRENSDAELALRLASSLQPLWLTRGRIQEGLNWLDAALADAAERGADATARARVYADKALLMSFTGTTIELEDAERTLATARELGDPALVARALTACGGLAQHDRELAGPYFAEAAGLAREIGDSRLLGQILALDALSALIVGEPVTAQPAAEEGLQAADSIGDAFVARQCRLALCWAQIFSSDSGRPRAFTCTWVGVRSAQLAPYEHAPLPVSELICGAMHT
jgi:hypothetical protein